MKSFKPLVSDVQTVRKLDSSKLFEVARPWFFFLDDLNDLNV
jgi:hypothetical protein